MIPIKNVLFSGLIIVVGVLAVHTTSALNALNGELSKPVIIAHRGSSGTAPENTMAAFKEALEVGADMIELDIHLSKDSVLIVCHDEFINRTTDGEGEIKNLTLDELNQFDAGSWYGEEFSGEKLPTLEDVFKLVNGQAKLLIEIKGKSKIYKGLEENLITLIAQYKAKDWVVVQSFHTPFLANIHQLDPGIQLYKLVVLDVPILPMYIDDGGRIGSLNDYNYCQAINPMDKFVTEKFIRKAHERGQKVFVWTVNDTEKASSILQMGADGIITNYPKKMKQFLQQ